jgi:hypothetical protein
MAIEVINPIVITEAQMKAVRKLALRDSKVNANQMAALLFKRAVVNTFKPVAKAIAEDARKRYAMAVAGGFPAPTYKGEDGKDIVLTADEYAKRAAEEYRLILSDLEA